MRRVIVRERPVHVPGGLRRLVLRGVRGDGGRDADRMGHQGQQVP